MAMYDDVVIRLLQLGYTVPAGGTPDAAVTYAIDRAAEKIKANINRTDIPDGLHYTWVDMAAGLFLFDKKTANLKAFLKLRDGSPLFDPVRQEGGIGIPCIQREDGSITFDWEEFM